MRYASPLDRLRAHAVVLPDGCWHWTGSTFNNGRPKITVRIRGKVQRIPVTRYVVEFVHGLRWGRNTRRTRVGAHSCDNGQCVNPEHIARSTQRANVRECVERGRHVSGFVIASGVYAGRHLPAEPAHLVRENPTTAPDHR